MPTGLGEKPGKGKNNEKDNERFAAPDCAAVKEEPELVQPCNGFHYKVVKICLLNIFLPGFRVTE